MSSILQCLQLLPQSAKWSGMGLKPTAHSQKKPCRCYPVQWSILYQMLILCIYSIIIFYFWLQNRLIFTRVAENSTSAAKGYPIWSSNLFKTSTLHWWTSLHCGLRYTLWFITFKRRFFGRDCLTGSHMGFALAWRYTNSLIGLPLFSIFNCPIAFLFSLAVQGMWCKILGHQNAPQDYKGPAHDTGLWHDHVLWPSDFRTNRRLLTDRKLMPHHVALAAHKISTAEADFIKHFRSNSHRSLLDLAH